MRMRWARALELVELNLESVSESGRQVGQVGQVGQVVMNEGVCAMSSLQQQQQQQQHDVWAVGCRFSRTKNKKKVKEENEKKDSGRKKVQLEANFAHAHDMRTARA